MRKIILILIVGIVALIAAIQMGLLSFRQDRPAQVPGVEVTSNGITATGGQAPSFEVETGTVAVGTRNATVAVPVPTVEVRSPDENRAAPPPAAPQPAPQP
ncbi:MAG: hypothetical protein V4696_04810 [Pseudomonadota bacterium]